MLNATSIRTADRRDAGAVSRIYVESWRATYQGILPSGYLAGLRAEKVAHAVQQGLGSPRSFYLIAESSRGPVGYISAGPCRSLDPIYASELYELYILPEAQGRGLGKQLLADMARKLYEARYYTLMVWVLARNPNRRFYEKRNGLYLRSKTIAFTGRHLKMDAFGWIDMTLAM